VPTGYVAGRHGAQAHLHPPARLRRIAMIALCPDELQPHPVRHRRHTTHDVRKEQHRPLERRHDQRCLVPIVQRDLPPELRRPPRDLISRKQDTLQVWMHMRVPFSRHAASLRRSSAARSAREVQRRETRQDIMIGYDWVWVRLPKPALDGRERERERKVKSSERRNGSSGPSAARRRLLFDSRCCFLRTRRPRRPLQQRLS